MFRLLKAFIISTTLALAITLVPSAVRAQSTQPPYPVNIYLFWGDGCPHCAKAKPVLEEIDRQMDNVSLYKYEVYHDSGNQQLLKQTVKQLNVNGSGVPLIVVGDKAYLGYSDASASVIKSRVEYCSANICPDSVASIVGQNSAAPSPTNASTTTQADSDVINLPIFGEVHAKDFSLPVLTIIIAALDGFNPCAMWTLIFLISLLLGMESRKRMWILGTTFIVASALVYLLFLGAWLSVFAFIGYVTWVKIIIGLVALGAGGYYLYDFYKNREGTCKVTANESRQKVFARIRDITHKKSLWIALIGIVLLAFAVNMVELVCSAGLPAVYTNILSTFGLTPWQYFGYLLLYILVFMADDLFVFVASMLTLQVVGAHGKYARYSHFVGGVLMVILGMILIFAPQLLMFG